MEKYVQHVANTKEGPGGLFFCISLFFSHLLFMFCPHFHQYHMKPVPLIPGNSGVVESFPEDMYKHKQIEEEIFKCQLATCS